MSDDQTFEDDLPEDDAPDAVGSVEDELERLAAEAAEWRDKALRAVADAENVKRRAEREMNDARAFAIQRFAKDLLGVADNLQRALAAAPRENTDPAVAGLTSGLELTEKALLQAFENNGLKRLAPAAGDKFDPNVHQAMMEQLSETLSGGQVIDTLQTGYELFGRVVRPAMVVVAAKGSGPQAASPQQAAGAYAATDAATGGAFDGKA
ncbi:MAG TPA: nucleotide exchange factor GrpE [Caulobacteraceae bacterium]|jgi:molecular chaperone GrpE